MEIKNGEWKLVRNKMRSWVVWLKRNIEEIREIWMKISKKYYKGISSF